MNSSVQGGRGRHAYDDRLNGETLDLVVDADYVDDPLSDVKCILSMCRKG